MDAVWGVSTLVGLVAWVCRHMGLTCCVGVPAHGVCCAGVPSHGPFAWGGCAHEFCPPTPTATAGYHYADFAPHGSMPDSRTLLPDILTTSATHQPVYQPAHPPTCQPARLSAQPPARSLARRHAHPPDWQPPSLSAGHAHARERRSEIYVIWICLMSHLKHVRGRLGFDLIPVHLTHV